MSFTLKNISLCQVLRLVPIPTGNRPCKMSGAATAQPKSERIRRTVGAIGQQECLSKLILFGETSLRRALTDFVEHYHAERNHQGKGNVLLFPSIEKLPPALGPTVRRQQRLGGLLNYYARAA